MHLRRLRGPLVAVMSTLLLAGGSVALATGHSSHGQAVSTVAKNHSHTGRAHGQAVSTVVKAAEAGAADEHGSTGPDTDNVQVQDESGAADAAEAGTPAAEGSEAAGTEADGPGGHEDPAGQNVDHQFDGEE